MNATATPRIEVVVGALAHDRRILLTQRPWFGESKLLWECPGGKVEVYDDRRHDRALRREWREELDADVSVEQTPFYIADLDPPTVPHRYRVFFYRVTSPGEWPRYTAIGCVGFGWFTASEVATLRMTPANMLCKEQLMGLLA